ncbi:DEAD/DEAH box helicase family protein [Paracoccus sp. N5]|uniref:DEAD/DEAH box helicase family protein n=1 Tax=Paracoccus sp. N5 TaxID=1101189 RepID=UPI000376C2B6|nr:DEAD/DEAH box helicase family protein [Paracoccus sp. N5]
MLNFTPAKIINLRDYQEDAVEALRQGIRIGTKRQILCAGTGAGKTVMAAHLLRQAHEKGSYALFLVDRVELVKQTSRTLDEYGIPHGIVQGEHLPENRTVT